MKNQLMSIFAVMLLAVTMPGLVSAGEMNAAQICKSGGTDNSIYEQIKIA